MPSERGALQRATFLIADRWVSAEPQPQLVASRASTAQQPFISPHPTANNVSINHPITEEITSSHLTAFSSARIVASHRCGHAGDPRPATAMSHSVPIDVPVLVLVYTYRDCAHQQAAGRSHAAACLLPGLTRAELNASSAELLWAPYDLEGPEQPVEYLLLRKELVL